MPWLIVAGLNFAWLLIVCLMMWLVGMREATMWWWLFGGMGVLSILGALLSGNLIMAAQGAGFAALTGFFVAGWVAGSLQRSWAARFTEAAPTYFALYDQIGDSPPAEPRLEGRLLVLDKHENQPDWIAFRELPTGMLAFNADDVRTVAVLDDGQVTLFTVKQGMLDRLLVRKRRYSSTTYIEVTSRGGQVQSVSSDATPLAVYSYLEGLPRQE